MTRQRKTGQPESPPFDSGYRSGERAGAQGGYARRHGYAGEGVKNVGVVGAGAMGNGIAQVFAAAGFTVTLVDVSEQALERGMAAITDSLGRMAGKASITQRDKADTLSRITTATSLGTLSAAQFVVEAVPEDLAVKSAVLGQLDRICPAQTPFASNTSSISLTRLAAQTGRPERVIGMHFMNPAPIMKLVEIIRALQTDDRTCDLARRLASDLGKTPLLANDSPGFVANRILVPMINEAIFALHEGVATAEAIDEIMKLGANHPIGPLALADLVGLDVVLSALRVIREGMGDPKFRPCPLLIKMVDANKLGRKTGVGFYDYR